jgi:colanic acid biosynthesis glycosyl transferase WcaI
MKICLINQFYPPDIAPTGKLAASLAVHRATHGDQVTILAGSGAYSPEDRSEQPQVHPNLHINRLWTPSLGKGSKLTRILDYAAFYSLASLSVMFLPRQDVIIALTTPPFIAWAAVLHKWLHPTTKIVLWNMDCYPEIAEESGVLTKGRWISRFLRALNRKLFLWIDQVVCLDRAMRNVLEAHYGRVDQRPHFSIIPNWEPAAQFPPDQTLVAWRDIPELGVENPFIILYLGNAGFGHRFDAVLEAAEQLKEEPFVFLFVGGGQKWPWLADAAVNRNLQNVILHPYVTKATTPAVMAMADCALITMNDAALGLISPSKLHANLAMSLPILYIGPASSNVDDAIQEHAVGLSIRHDEVGLCIDFLRELRSNPALHEQYKSAARQAFDTTYNDKKTLPHFDRLLASLATNLD